MKKIMLIALYLIFASTGFSADVLLLNNQKQFKGKVIQIKQCSILFKVEKDVFIIPADDIFSITFENVNNRIYKKYLKLDDDYQKCFKGTQDAEMLHGKVGGHVLLGVLFGPFAMVGAALANPNPYKGAYTLMESRNKDLFEDREYLQCYKKAAKKKNVLNVGIGWAMWMVFYLAVSS